MVKKTFFRIFIYLFCIASSFQVFSLKRATAQNIAAPQPQAPQGQSPAQLDPYGSLEDPNAVAPAAPQPEAQLPTHVPPATQPSRNNPGTQGQAAENIKGETPAPPASHYQLLKTAPERTQFFWQPLKGLSAITLSAQGTNIAYTDNNGAGANISSVAQINSTYALYYQYGLSRLWAISLELSTSPNQIQTIDSGGAVVQTSTGGPNDIVLTFKNTTPFSRWNLHYGASFNFSLDINQPATITSQGNNFSGGNGATPYLGTSYNLFGKSFLGARLDYFYRGTRIVDPNRSITAAEKKTSGNQSNGAVFFEWHLHQWIISLRQAWTEYDGQETVVNTTNTTSNSYYTSTQTGGLLYYFLPGNMVSLEGTFTETPAISLAGNETQNNSLTYGAIVNFRSEF